MRHRVTGPVPALVGECLPTWALQGTTSFARGAP
jgi:hypothetical protein